MKKIILIVLGLTFITSSYADEFFKLNITSNADSHKDIYSYMGNMYGRELTAIVDKKEIPAILVCMVDPNLSDAYADKLLPGALIECGISLYGGVHQFQENLDINELLKEIDSPKGINKTVLLKNSISFWLW